VQRIGDTNRAVTVCQVDDNSSAQDGGMTESRPSKEWQELRPGDCRRSRTKRRGRRMGLPPARHTARLAPRLDRPETGG
jgi:hypothetical protein